MGKIYGNYVDIFNRTIYPSEINFQAGGNIVSIRRLKRPLFKSFILPGFVDAHVHIESSMLLPEAFSDIIVPRGTVATVSDPHEIANVVGIKGVRTMFRLSKKAKCKINFSIPSCVPSTSLDGSGAALSDKEVRMLADSGNYVALSEVMDVNAVLSQNKEMCNKLQAAKENHLVIDGHAPLLTGENLTKYIDAGVQTDHECSNIDEAREKIKKGMTVLIREGSAAKNYNSLKQLIAECPDSLMFCTDDSHPDKIMDEGTIDHIVRTAVKDGYDLFDVLKIACVNPVLYYKLPVGLLREGDKADFIVVNDLKKFKIKSVFIDGREVYDKEKVYQLPDKYEIGANSYLNNFKRHEIQLSELKNQLPKGKHSAIKFIPGELITEEKIFSIDSAVENFESDLQNDILKIVYINRYIENSTPQIEYITGLGLKEGAIASSVSHDSHNIIAVGTNDVDLLQAINSIIRTKGGISFINNKKTDILPLPVCGIISDWNGSRVRRRFSLLKRKAAHAGTQAPDPFMALSFMALIVIPFLKIGEKGLFDYNTFSFRNKNGSL